MSKRYDVNEVKRSVSVRKYLKDQGVKVRGNRCVASWRGGDDLTCQLYEMLGENCVYDNKADRRLSVIDLCMEIEGKSFGKAVAALGERYGLTATDGTRRSAKKPKPKVAPNWVRVSWLVIHAEDDALVDDALAHKGETDDHLTDADVEWTKLVLNLLGGELLGWPLDAVMQVVIDAYHQTMTEA